MTPILMAMLAAVMLGTSFLSGIFGMAGGMVLMGVLLATLPLPTAMALHALTQLTSNGGRSLLWWRYIVWRPVGGYVLGCLLALVAWSLWLYVPSKAVALLMLGVVPFLTRLVPPRFQPDPGRVLHGLGYGAACMTLMILTGVAGPLLDSFFLAGRMDRRQIVATKGVCQVFGHVGKLVYFGGLIENAASVDPVMIAIAVATTVLGTTLARRVLEAMNDTQYRLWANRIITVVCGYYVAHGTFLLVTA